MSKYFGTDGIRGVAGEELTASFAARVGAAAASLTHNTHPVCLLGRDTRESGEILSGALAEGLCQNGADVVDLGVIPTPAVAFLVQNYRADMAVMISASHNPWQYNGIKIFGPNGYKLDDCLEQSIEAFLDGEQLPAAASRIGELRHSTHAADDYLAHLHSSVETDLSALKVVVDCANGSACRTAPRLFAALGCSPLFLHTAPNGRNINDRCGSTHLEDLRKAVPEAGADLGVAFDGDADRCLCVDERGEVIDGDMIMTLLALERHATGCLPHAALVGTVMTNLGIIDFCRQNGVHYETTTVGDRFVLERMLQKDYTLGGEQSGHIIFREFATTGDGQLTALQMMQYLARRRMKEPAVKLSQLTAPLQKYPQALQNVPVTAARKQEIFQSAALAQAIRTAEQTLGDHGRVLVRMSGTENLIRVLCEGKDASLIAVLADELAHTIRTLCDDPS